MERISIKTINPFEIGLERLVDLEKTNFIGQKALMKTNKKSIRLMGTNYVKERP